MASMAAADEIQLCYDPNYVISFPPTIKKVEVATNAVIAFDNDTFKNPSEVELLVARFDALTAKHLIEMKASISKIAALGANVPNDNFAYREAIRHIDEFPFEPHTSGSELIVEEDKFIFSVNELLKRLNNGHTLQNNLFDKCKFVWFSKSLQVSDSSEARDEARKKMKSESVDSVNEERCGDGVAEENNLKKLEAEKHAYETAHPGLASGDWKVLRDNLERATNYEKHAKYDRALCHDVIKAGKILRKWGDGLQGMAAFTQRMQTRRSNAAAIAIFQTRASLENAYARKIVTTIAELNTQIGGAIASDQLHSEIFAWKSNAILANGAGRGLSTKYLLYDEPLGFARVDLAKAGKFRTKLAELAPIIADDIRASLAAEIDTTEQILKNFVTDLSGKGLRGQFERQKNLTAARKSRLVNPTKDCLGSISQFEAIAQTKVSDETMRAAGRSYVREVDSCTL